jgi:hypothetical protein
LEQVSTRRDLHGLLAGWINRILLDGGRIAPAVAEDRFTAALSFGAAAADKAAWAEGFLSGSGLLLVHDIALVSVLDDWVATLGPEDFLDVLPLLRRTFATFTPAERANIGDAVKHLGSGPSRPIHHGVEVLDEDRAAGALLTVAVILSGGR